MNLRKPVLIALLLAAAPAAGAPQEDNAAAIRAGRNLATSVCFACHIVTNNQNPPPVLGPGIPSFQDIADRPDVTAGALVERMKDATWHDAALPPTRLPMSHLSDRERSEVAAYILSLRHNR